MSRGLKRDKCLDICGINKNQFYHQSKGGRRGRRASRHTLQLLGAEVLRRGNGEVIDQIKQIFEHPLIDYGYRKMSAELQLRGYLINHKKVYRLMKQHRLLRPKPNREAKNYVKYRIVMPLEPLRLMETDIKQVWLETERRYAYILTIIDVFSRVVLYWTVGLQMRQQQVQYAWQQVIENFLQPLDLLAREVHIEVRSDNGPQFCAKKLRQFLKQNYLMQTFTHPYTPQENGHIESFHAILGNGLRGKVFDDLKMLEAELKVFYQFYNFERIHGSTVKLPPITFWQQWQQQNIEREVVDKKTRKVRFKLKVKRQTIPKVQPADLVARPAGNVNWREVLSLVFEGSMPDKINLITQSDGAVLNVQPTNLVGRPAV